MGSEMCIRDRIVSSAISYLEPFDDPIMALNVSDSDFSLTDLMHNRRPVSLYLTTPVADLERVQSLHRLFFTLAGTRNTEHLSFENGKPTPLYKHPLLEVFDECAHLGYSPVIQKHFSLASGYGIRGLFVFQDFSQLFDLYGRNESITSNCDVKVAFAPNNLETASYLSKLLGTETREKKTKHTFARPLLTPDECSRFSREKSIIIRNGHRPIMGDKVPYYEVPEFVRRTKIPTPRSGKIISKATRWWERFEREEDKEASLPKTRQVKPRRKSKKSKATINDNQIDLFPLLTKQVKEVQHDSNTTNGTITNFKPSSSNSSDENRSKRQA